VTDLEAYSCLPTASHGSAFRDGEHAAWDEKVDKSARPVLFIGHAVRKKKAGSTTGPKWTGPSLSYLAPIKAELAKPPHGTHSRAAPPCSRVQELKDDTWHGS
jgi:hypothetical protein